MSLLPNEPDKQTRPVLYQTMIPLFAAQAAVEIEMIIQDLSSSLIATRNLAGLLGSKADGSTMQSSSKALATPGAEMLMNRALRSLENGTEISTIQQLTSEIDKLANSLETLTEKTPTEELERFRDFCSSLALTTASATYSVSKSSGEKMTDQRVIN